MVLALVSAASESISCSLKYTSSSSVPASPDFSLLKSFSSLSNHSLSSSPRSTVCRTVFSVPAHSCSTNIIFTFSGMGISLLYNDRKSVDFPTPFLPIRPYFLPYAKVSVLFRKISSFPTWILIISQCRSLTMCAFFSRTGPDLGRNPASFSLSLIPTLPSSAWPFPFSTTFSLPLSSPFAPFSSLSFSSSSRLSSASFLFFSSIFLCFSRNFFDLFAGAIIVLRMNSTSP
mmetsp:Transcript_42710/g.166870  ORF Transcript_42710/g.166870 Transcript_42710/m.166870 type:complete len:231 (-) Transcript_42710:97-789(-)